MHHIARGVLACTVARRRFLIGQHAAARYVRAALTCRAIACFVHTCAVSRRAPSYCTALPIHLPHQLVLYVYLISCSAPGNVSSFLPVSRLSLAICFSRPRLSAFDLRPAISTCDRDPRLPSTPRHTRITRAAGSPPSARKTAVQHALTSLLYHSPVTNRASSLVSPSTLLPHLPG